MVQYIIIGLENIPGHTHGIRIQSGDLEGFVFAFGRIEFLDENTHGEAIFDFEHRVITEPTKPATYEEKVAVMSTVLDKILKDSAGITEQEEREREEAEAKAFAEQFPDSTVMAIDEHTTIEIQELALE